jgi:hypothetical protein
VYGVLVDNGAAHLCAIPMEQNGNKDTRNPETGEQKPYKQQKEEGNKTRRRVERRKTKRWTGQARYI